MKKVQKKKMLKLQKKMLKDVVKEYQFVNPQQRSVIIFHNGPRDGCGSSTVVMPEAFSSEKSATTGRCCCEGRKISRFMHRTIVHRGTCTSYTL
jgi:hypothetical protein